jgi:glutathione S-transferase
MRLHYHPLSPYSRKASTAIAMRKDDIALRVIELGKGELESAAFREISPFGKMPVLETRAGPIIESTSIIEYLEEMGPRLLLPQNVERIARHFDRLGDLYLIAPVAALWWEPESEQGKAAESVARTCWPLFENALRTHPFVTGGSFTMGDLAGAIGTDYFMRLGVTPSDAVRAWRDRCFAIPEMRASLESALPFVESTLGVRVHMVAV